MIVIDVNLLLYAVNEDGEHHGAARRWLEDALSSDEPIALAWVVILAFLRLTTSGRVFPKPLTAEQALGAMGNWLHRPIVRTLSPGPEHWRILNGLLEECGAAGNLTTDAHLAALAIENGCRLCSTDTDFARFRRLNWSNPLAA